MGLHKLTAGSGYTYLTRQVAANDVTDRGAGDLGSYYTERGENPGTWLGRGLASLPQLDASQPVTELQMLALFGAGRHPDSDRLAREIREAGGDEPTVAKAIQLGVPYRVYDTPSEFHRRSAEAFRTFNADHGLPPGAALPPEERARIRTELAEAMFTEVHGRPPLDSRELSGHLTRISRPQTKAVAGYDLTFSPVKSISVLWAVAPPAVAAQIERAHADAVANTLAWLEDHVVYTRRGHNGVAQVDVTGLIVAAFTHRDSRAGDPDLHTHLVVSNKVQAVADGTWLALDGRPLHQSVVAAAERYTTRLEALLVERLGVAFADRAEGQPGKRAVREIVGIDGALPRRWSSRRTDIDARRADLAAHFQADHHRPPTATEAVALAQQATLETRPDKHLPRSHAEQRATWWTEALEILGGPSQLNDYVTTALRPPATRTAAVTPAWIDSTARQVLTTVAETRATWQVHHLRAEAERQIRTVRVGLAEVDAAVEGVVNRCIAWSIPLEAPERGPESGGDALPEPLPLRRADGSSVFDLAGSARYSSAAVLAAERNVLEAADRHDGQAIRGQWVDAALAEAHTAGHPLNDGQAALVRDLACSGVRVQLALAPAGTGKTTALRVLTAAWRNAGGTVVGLAPSAAAAALLGDALGAPTETLAKLTHALQTGAPLPAWAAACGRRTLLLVDEAGMAGTQDLAAAVTFVTSRGGSVRLIGDDRQLAAVGAGGLLRDLADRHGAASLSAVVRFTYLLDGSVNHAEAAASLALRAGDPAALGFYLDHGRVHVGDASTVLDQAYGAWATDRAAGRDALLLAPTRRVVADLNERARRDRIAAESHPIGREVQLTDGLRASAGDLVVTRRNDRSRRLDGPEAGRDDWVRNGDRWTIESVGAAGDVVVARVDNGRRAALPAAYVSEHLVLGYASTVHTAQGSTADTCHTVVTGTEDRRLLYVALTRGRYANHAYVAVGGNGDPHSLITRDALLPVTAAGLLERVITRDTVVASATSHLTDQGPAAARLATAADRYSHALLTAVDDHLGPARLAALDTLGAATVPGLTTCAAWPALRYRLALIALEGDDAAGQLTRAARRTGLDNAADPAAVLDWRLRPPGQPGRPLPWLAPVPRHLAHDHVWGPYLLHRAQLVHTLAGHVADEARAWAVNQTPAWATALRAAGDASLLPDVAVWRAAHDVDQADLRPTGPKQSGTQDAFAQELLDQRVDRTAGETRLARWTQLIREVDPRLSTDPYTPVLADHLDHLNRTGVDVPALLRRAGSDRPLPDEHAAAALWWRLTDSLATLPAKNPPGRSAAGQPATVAPRLRRGRPTGLLRHPEVPSEPERVRHVAAHSHRPR